MKSRSFETEDQSLSTIATSMATERLLGDYELLRLLGRGGMGSVYQARHQKLDKICAIKVLPGFFAEEPSLLERFHQEMRAIGRLDHPNIVRATDARAVAGVHFLVMEYIDGVNLAELTRRQGPWPICDACAAVEQAALALQHVHEHGLVHRDVKPSNLMATYDGAIRLLDMGLARLREEPAAHTALTAAGELLGTPDFTAPEQWNNAHAVDIRADLYSLGGTLFYLLTGQAPFASPKRRTLEQKMHAHLKALPPPLTKLRPDAPAELAVLVSRLLAKDPNERIETPGEAARQLRKWTSGSDLAQLVRKASASQLTGPSELPPQNDTHSKEPLTHPNGVGEPESDAQQSDAPFPRRRKALWGLVTILLFASGTAAALVYTSTSRKNAPSQTAISAGPRKTTPTASHSQETPIQDASSQRTVSTSPEIQVTALQVKHFRYRGNEGEALGEIGRETSAAEVGDDVRVSVKFSQPCYAYLLAINTDGAIQLVMPEDESTPPPKTDRLEAYPHPLDFFTLTEGAGGQAFVAVVSRKALPPFQEWRTSETQPITQQLEPFHSPGVLRFDGELYHLVFAKQGLTRGAKTRRLPHSLAEWIRSLQRRHDIETVAAIAFPVTDR